MRDLKEIKSNRRLAIVNIGEDGLAAFLIHPAYKSGSVVIVASWGGGWEHVSVSNSKRCPTWDEMCMIKDIFWREDEWCCEFHPAEADYVNNHNYCLHIWKPLNKELPTPPSWMVGLRKGQTMAEARREMEAAEN